MNINISYEQKLSSLKYDLCKIIDKIRINQVHSSLEYSYLFYFKLWNKEASQNLYRARQSVQSMYQSNVTKCVPYVRVCIYIWSATKQLSRKCHLWIKSCTCHIKHDFVNEIKNIFRIVCFITPCFLLKVLPYYTNISPSLNIIHFNTNTQYIENT